MKVLRMAGKLIVCVLGIVAPLSENYGSELVNLYIVVEASDSLVTCYWQSDAESCYG